MIQQDEKVENIIDIFNKNNLLNEINKDISNKNYKIRIEGLKLVFENYSNLPKNESYNFLLKGAKDGSKNLKLWVIESFNSTLGKNIPIEVRRDICRILMKTNDEIIKKKSIEILNIPVSPEFSKLTLNENNIDNIVITKQTKIEKDNNNSFLTPHDIQFSDKEMKLYGTKKIDVKLKEYILCLTLWMGGDGAIFDQFDILQYLPSYGKEIEFILGELEKEKILKKIDGNYSLTKRGSILVDSILLVNIAKWYNASVWADKSDYSTIHHGFIKDKRNNALSNFSLSIRSFITDYFQFILENFVEFYDYKKMSYFSSFRKILILISLNPTLDFFKKNNNEFGQILTDFSDSEVIKTINYNNGKLIIIKNDLLMRHYNKDRNLK